MDLAILLFLSLSTVVVRSFKAQSFIYQKDMSEYCRRRVVSSVFLGRHVTEAHSQILHFSQLEVPYSCAISIRAESGSNIVLVIELKNVTEACHATVKPGTSNGTGQVNVYDLGETFGGYWGMLPSQILAKTSPTAPRYYTIESTSSTPSLVDYTYYSDDDNKKSGMDFDDTEKPASRSEQNEDPVEKEPKQSYMKYVVPLVNVSGELVHSNVPLEKAFDNDMLFDIVNDVAPKPGVSYSTKVVPLLKYSIYREPDWRRDYAEGNNTYSSTNYSTYSNGSQHDGDSIDTDQRYGMDYEVFTPDPRLKYPFLESILSGKQRKFHRGQKFNANKILKFRPQNGPMFHRKNHPSTHLDNIAVGVPTKIMDKSKQKTTKKPSMTIAMGDEPKLLDDLIMALNRGQEKQYDEKNLDDSQVLKKIANMEHNRSVYLSPNISMYNKMTTHFKSMNIHWTGTKNSTYSLTSTHKSKIKEVTKNTNKIRTPTSKTPTRKVDIQVSTKKHTVTNKMSLAGTKTARTTTKTVKSITTASHQNTKLKSTQIRSSLATVAKVRDPIETTDKGLIQSQKTTKIDKANEQLPIHMVNRESWENIVQAAPKLANVLHTSKAVGSDPLKKKSRRKRLIQAIDIEVARPHNITGRPDVAGTTEENFHFTDKQDFAQLVELQDDEIVGRIALRHIRRYVGNLLLDVCDTPVQKSRQVFLFNTSRILLTINDFTIKRMTLVVTPARTLSSTKGRCPQQHLECQVSGARVCIESTCACDGVPNCGSYDVYDEDRLRCNKDKGSQHSVYLAAFAFLAVLFTGLYTVHYWLRRCVPKVSDAFFIYTDGTENILYLDTIMKSPAGGHDMYYVDSNIFADALMDDLHSIESHPKLGIFQNFLRYFRKKPPSLELSSLDQIQLDIITAGTNRRPKIFSFAESEITRIVGTTVDETTQTGESLEMQFIEGRKKVEDKKGVVGRRNTALHTKIDVRGSVADVDKDSELSMLKFMKETKATGGRRGTILMDVPEDVHRLRLNTNRTVAVGDEREIHSMLYDHDSLSSDLDISSVDKGNPSTSHQAKKQLRFNDNLTTISSDDGEEDYVTVKRKLALLGGPPIEDEEVQDHSAAKDFKRFWSSNKGNKKSKKKTQSSLR